ncbi:MAG: hypothetical protein ACOX2E_03410 [Syntrophaceticus sp.]
MNISVLYKDVKLAPRKFRGKVTSVFERFVVIETEKGYKTTLFLPDVSSGEAIVMIANPLVAATQEGTA